MKNNLISSIASWKSAALLGLVALIATVAFSGVLSTTKIADAGTAAPATAAQGATVTVTTGAGGSGGWVNYSFATSSTASGSFVSGGGQTLVCKDNTSEAEVTANPCDSSATANSVAVKVKIASSSANGPLVVVANTLTDGATDYTVITVTNTLTATSLTVKPSSTSISATGGTATLDVTLLNSAKKGVASTFNLITSYGLFTDGCTTNNLQVCEITTVSTPDTATTDGKPNTAPTLSAQGAPGVATITATAATLSATAKVTFYGPAANISAEVEENSIAWGGSTFVVVTVTDAAGSPVTGTPLTAAANVTTDPKAPPAGLSVSSSVGKDTSSPADGDYADKGDIPNCDTTRAKFDDGSDDTADDEDDYPAGATNAAGKCVIQVTANAPTAAGSPGSTRGEHSVTVSLGAGKKSATVTLNVGGPPASITSAPDSGSRVDELAETPITVTVWDDADVPVGAVAVNARLVGGDGVVIGPATADKAMTKDGKASFTYIAALSGEAIIRVTAGSGTSQISHAIRIAVGPEPVAAPAPTWSATPVSGWNNLTWMGESGASVADNIPEGVTAVYHWNAASQSWDAYFADADDVPGGMDFSTLTNGASYWIASN